MPLKPELVALAFHGMQQLSRTAAGASVHPLTFDCCLVPYDSEALEAFMLRQQVLQLCIPGLGCHPHAAWTHLCPGCWCRIRSACGTVSRCSTPGWELPPQAASTPGPSTLRSGEPVLKPSPAQCLDGSLVVHVNDCRV